jgi:hypothetical protein
MEGGGMQAGLQCLHRRKMPESMGCEFGQNFGVLVFHMKISHY